MKISLDKLPCNQPAITVAVGRERVRIEVNKIAPQRKMGERPSSFVAGTIGMVKVALFFIEGNSRKQITAEFAPMEIVAILGDEWPNADNIENIRRCVRDRRFYPLRDPQQPSDKSLDAQGQTKKPGSHSQSRHR